MENYNEIPKTGTIGGMVDNINANFQLTKEMLERIQLSKDNSRGLFTTATALRDAYPSPEVGDWAIVGSTSPFDIYICSTAGTWVDSGNDYNGGEVNLSEYAKKTSVDSLASTVSSEASRLRTDEAWLQRVDNNNMANGRQITTLGSQLTDMKTVDDRQDSDIEGIKEDLRNLNPVVVEGNVTNNPDNVFLTSDNDEITPKERTTSLSAKGHYIMRPTDNFAAKLKANYIHEIPFDVDLGGASVTIPANAVLKFTGGKIANGSLVLQNTYLDGDVKLSADVAVSGTCANLTAKQSWFVSNNVDAWHRFINNVDCQVYEYTRGEYTMNEDINKTISRINIKGNGAVLNRDGSGGGTAYYLKGAQDAVTRKTYLAADAVFGTVTITVANASDFIVGDYIAIKDNSTSSFSTERNYQQGEFAKIRKISGNVITLDHALFGNYYLKDKNNSAKVDGDGNSLLTITAVRFAEVHIRDLKLVSTNDDGLHSSYGFRMTDITGTFDCVESYNFTYKLITTRGINLSCNNCITDTVNDYQSVDDYGLGLYSVQNAIVAGGRFSATVHGITISAPYTGETNVMSRFVSVFNSFATNSSQTFGFDSHVGEYLTFQNCNGSGINASGNVITIDGCNFTNAINYTNHTNFNGKIANCTAAQISLYCRKTTRPLEISEDNWIPQTETEQMIVENNVVRGAINLTYYGQTIIDWYPNINNVRFLIRNNVFAGGTMGTEAQNTTYATNGMEIELRGNVVKSSVNNLTIYAKNVALNWNTISLIPHIYFYCKSVLVDGDKADDCFYHIQKANDAVIKNSAITAPNYAARLVNVSTFKAENNVINATYGIECNCLYVTSVAMIGNTASNMVMISASTKPTAEVTLYFRENRAVKRVIQSNFGAPVSGDPNHVKMCFVDNYSPKIIDGNTNNILSILIKGNRQSEFVATAATYVGFDSLVTDLDA